MKIKSKRIGFESRDGLKLRGTLTTPSSGVIAALLLVHGISSDRSEWGIFDLVANELAEEGITSLRFDYRGHGKSKLDTDKISLSGIQSDIMSAWDELESQLEPHGKSLKHYVLGSSFGGGLSYAAASRIGRIDRVFLMAPVFNYFIDIENSAPRWHSELKRRGQIRYNDLRLGRALVNEAFYLDPLVGPPVPATIFHGTADTDVVIELSRKVAARHSNFELVPVDGAGHVLNVPDDFDLELDASWAFIKFMIEQIRKRIS